MCMPYLSLKAAQACVAYITEENRPDGKDTLPASSVSIRAFEANDIQVYAVFFPADKMLHVILFWQDVGTGVSSRVAEDFLKGEAKEIPVDTVQKARESSGPYQAIRERIAYLAERAPVGPPREKKVSQTDVYLYQTGMSAIYYVHDHLLRRAGANSKSKTAMFGFPFHQTTHIFKHFGPGMEFFPLGTEYDQLEAFLAKEKAAGHPVMALWTEVPSNPLLVTSDLHRLRRLADEYKFVLLVDETVGSFCSIDVLPIADIIVTSLTKSFSGYADVMGGSAVLNPSSSIYSDLKAHFDKHHINDLYIRDARTIRSNSEDYLHRSAILNSNAETLVSWLQKRSKNPRSTIKTVHYPTTSPSNTQANYDAFKRASTPDFTPGYGCLFSVEFKSREAAIAFYENLHVYHGPHLGAHRTLALGYAYAVYGNPEDVGKMAGWGLSDAQIRVSTGLEDKKGLLDLFKYAVMKSEEAVQA